MDTGQVQPIAHAIRCIAGNCDGAIARDEIGFDGTDTHFGKALAAIPDEHWTAGMTYDAWIILRKYRGQLLANHGIDYDKLPVPEETKEDGRAQARAASRAEKLRSLRKVAFVDDNFVVSFPYEEEIVKLIKDIDYGLRAWDGVNKRWKVRQEASEALLRIVDEFGFKIHDSETEMRLNRPSPLKIKSDGMPGQIATVGKVVEHNNQFHIVFGYNPMMVQDVKASVPERRWNPDNRCWVAPLSSSEEVFEFADRWKLLVEPSLRSRIKEMADQARKMREASHSDNGQVYIDVLGGTLRPFQAAGVEYAIKSRRCFIADQMGLGKTVQALAAMQHEDTFPALVICPASIKIQWKKEADKWLPNRMTFIVNGLRNGNPLPDGADIFIINYDILESWEPELSSMAFKALVLDESHYIKNPRAKRTKAVIKLAQHIPDDGLRLLLTGTPILNRPNELPSQLQAIDRLAEFGGMQKFRSRYCWDENTYSYTGARFLDELNKKLRSTCFIRRTKDQVVKELPDKARYFVHMEADEKAMAEYAAASDAICSKMMEDAVMLAEQLGVDVSKAMESPEWAKQEVMHLTEIGILRRLAAAAKIPATIEWIRNMVESGNKVVVFAHHKDIVRKIASEMQAPSITGDDSQTDRADTISRFKQGLNDVIVLSIQAAGMGIDGLQIASDVLFVEQAWSPSVLEQAEDRLHRMGQENSVSVWYARIKDTIDDDIFAMLDHKRAVIGGAVDGSPASVISALVKKGLEKQLIN
jgi:superfamily II DNA or RNA helicase